MYIIYIYIYIYIAESLYENMLNDQVVINNKTSYLLAFSCTIKFNHYIFLAFPDPFSSCCIYIYIHTIYIYIYIYVIERYNILYIYKTES